jgi:DNA-binding response OmpR family regulator
MRPRVLIADGDGLLLAACRAFLAAEGVEADTVTNAPDCLAALRGPSPALLVLDPAFPDAGSVLAAAAGRGVPVLLLTADPAVAARRPADCAVMLKPVVPALLAGYVREVSAWD